MHLNPDGWVDALESLQQTFSRKVIRGVMAWVRGPHWIPSPAVLKSYRTSTRGQVRNLRTGALIEATTVSGEIGGHCAWR